MSLWAGSVAGFPKFITVEIKTGFPEPESANTDLGQQDRRFSALVGLFCSCPVGKILGLNWRAHRGLGIVSLFPFAANFANLDALGVKRFDTGSRCFKLYFSEQGRTVGPFQQFRLRHHLDGANRGMTEPTFRLRTDGGLSKQYTLKRLRDKLSAGVVDDAAQCTADGGASWVPLGELIANSGSVATAETPEDPVNSESASIAHSETTVDEFGDNNKPGDNKPGDNGDSDNDGDLLRGQSRRLRRLPAGSGSGRLAKLRAARDANRKSGDTITSPEDLIGVSLASDRYKIVGRLGKGSMAYVLRAFDSRLLTDVVVKVPKPEKMTDGDIRDRFKRESQLLVQLSHPHVVKVLDVGEYNELPYVVMQLLSGGTLTDRINDKSNHSKGMAPESLKSWLREVARALDFCYRKGMVHRDVKPANILFDEDENAYVSDFGLTKIMYGDHDNIDPSETAAGIVLGTPNYISPEVVLGRKYDGRADQYSLGITVYHSLFGRAPMQGDNATATMINQTQKHLQLLSEIRSDVPRELALAVRKSIEKDPEKRFDTNEEFADAVLEGLRAPLGKTTVAAPVRTTDRPAAARASSPSSQSSTRQRRAGRKSTSSRSGGTVPAAAPPETADWLDMTSDPAIDDALPPRAGKPKAARSKKSQRKGGTQILGQQINPKLVIILAAGICILLLSLLVRWLMSSEYTPPTVPGDTVTDSAELNPGVDGTSGAINVATEPSAADNSGSATSGNRGKAAAAGPSTAATVSSSASGQARATATPPDAATDSAAAMADPATMGAADGQQAAVTFAAETPAPGSIPESAMASSPGTAASATVSAPAKQQVVRKPSLQASDLTIPFESGENLTAGPPDCPVMVVGRKVWNKASRLASVTLESDYPRQASAALSADGRLFATATKPPHQPNTDVVVWDTGTGKRLFTAKVDQGRYTDTILVSASTLQVGGRSSYELLSWDSQTGKERQAVQLPEAKFSRGNTALSHNGEVIATVSNDRLGVIKASDGTIVGPMQTPGDKPRTGGSRPSSSRPNQGANAPVYDSLVSLSFSPDDRELAGLATFPQPRILCWNARGELTLDKAVAVPAPQPDRDALQWFPDGTCWLVAGRIFDRDTGRIVVSAARNPRQQFVVYDDRHLCGTFASAPGKLSVREIPWDQIRASVARLGDPDAAWVSPNKPVGLDVQIDGVDAEVQSIIRRAIVRRLAEDGLRTAPEGTDAVFQVTGNAGSGEITIVLAVSAKPVWQTSIENRHDLGPNFSTADEASRKQVLDDLTAKTAALATPYFVPKNKTLTVLPLQMH